MTFIVYLMTISFTISLSAQNWEEEIGFIYTKAEYLMGTDRYEDAVKQLTIVINKNQQYKDALYLRALAKYNLKSYEGAKKDLLIAMDAKGLGANIVELMGLSEYELGEFEKALKNLKIAEVLAPDKHEIKVAIGEIYQRQGKYSLACHEWSEAFKYGSSKARSLMVKHCDAGIGSASEDDIAVSDNDDIFEVAEEPRVEAVVRDRNAGVGTTKQTTDYEDVYVDEESKEGRLEIEEEPGDRKIVIDDDINEIIIDEDLSLEIYGNGLGDRKIVDQPTILILSDISGKVAVQVCVNKAGRVESAELDEGRSTINKQSMISLAIRKAKQFWFAKSKDKEQCGLIVFNIVGS